MEEAMPQQIRTSPSPLVLAQIVTLLGDRPDPARAEVQFPLRGCRALTYVRGFEGGRTRAEIVDLGLAEVSFLAARPWEVGTELVVELHHIALGWHRWQCRVTGIERQGEAEYRINCCFETQAADEELSPAAARSSSDRGRACHDRRRVQGESGRA